MYATISRILIFLLFAISGLVAAMIINHEDAWRYICTYWIILMAKNLMDLCTSLTGEDTTGNPEKGDEDGN